MTRAIASKTGQKGEGKEFDYPSFIANKSQLEYRDGFDPKWIPDFLFDFQKTVIERAIIKGRSAIFADCGMGKTPMQLVWAENVVKETGGRVLILTPLAVSMQTVREAHKFGIEAHCCRDGNIKAGINVVNYEKLHLLKAEDFVGCVCDESSILKSFDGTYKAEITEFMRRMRYRLLCTATAAPNDYIELGTSSEALGCLGYMDMLNRFFVNNRNNSATGGGRMYGERLEWRFKGHAETAFWKWVCSWARAIRKPSDLGFDDGEFKLPPLIEREHVVKANTLPDGFLFSVPAEGLFEQREERKRTVKERCDMVAQIVNNTGKPALVWCHLNTEGDLLEKLIPDAIQVSGSDSDEKKEDKLMSFADGSARVLVTKPKIGAWGLNFQHCSHVTFFPSHSYEQYYQGVRRCWRFGQKNPVTVDVVASEGEIGVVKNLQRKSEQADKMFSALIQHMGAAMKIEKVNKATKKEEIPSWL